MRLGEALESMPELGVSSDLGKLRSHVKPEWIEEALAATGTASLRRRRMPAEQVLWLVLGMALLRNESIERLVALLDLTLPGGGELVARSAIVQARQRLGEEPLAYLFTVLAAEWATRSARAHAWRGLALYGIDGTTIRVPDTKENRHAFGGQSVGSDASCGYPLVRLVAVMALRSHLLSAVRFADFHTGEPVLAEQIWHELPDHSLTILDRHYLSAELLNGIALSGTQRHWLTRAKRTTELKTLERYSKTDELAQLTITPAMRSYSNIELPPAWFVRAIKYQRKGFPPSVLLTSLLDPKKYPAEEIVALYHERWELEVGYDEVKTHMLAREEAIRSKTPAGVRQELWGILLAYNLVRIEMERVADEAMVEPTRISFVNALSLIRYAWLASSTPPWAPGAIPKRLLDVRRHMKLLLLPPRVEGRSYPRKVKLKLSAYARVPSKRELN